MAYYFNKERLVVGKAFVGKDGIQYPANWLELASPEEIKAAGIKEVEQKVAKTKTASTKIKQSLDDKPLKDQKKKLVKDGSGNNIIIKGMRTRVLEKEEREFIEILKLTDHYVIRKIETGEQIPDDIAMYRQSIREIYCTRVARISDCKSAEELSSIISDRSKLPAYPTR